MARRTPAQDAYEQAHQRRTRAVFAIAAVDAVWSNRAAAWFHLACAAAAPSPTVTLSNLQPSLDRCAACGALLSEPPR